MLKTSGISLPLASTILKFYQSNAFPIIDQRAYRQAFSTKLPNKASADLYLKYIKKCIEIGKKYKILFGKIDEVLYQKDIGEGNTS